MTERAIASETFGVGVIAPLTERANERGILIVEKYDREMVDYVARKLGLPRAGEPGFRQFHTPDFQRYGVKPYEVRESEYSNLITTAGWTRLIDLAIGAGGQAYTSGVARIGVGTATAAAVVGDTNLAAATGPTNRFFSFVTGNGTNGTGTGTRRLSFVATFGTGDGNFAWAEWGIDQGGPGTGTGAATAPLLNRAVSAQGTKASGQTWTATALIDFT